MRIARPRRFMHAKDAICQGAAGGVKRALTALRQFEPAGDARDTMTRHVSGKTRDDILAHAHAFAEESMHSARDTSDSFIPLRLRLFLRRRMMEAGGTALLATCALLALALASWSVLDPSWNRAVEAPARNLLGLPGAVIADEMLNRLGLASVVLLVVPVMWAARLLAFRGVARWHARLAWMMLATLLVAGLAGHLPRPPGWPLHVGLGGHVGDVLVAALDSFLGLFLRPLPALVASVLLLGVAAGMALTRALGMGPARATILAPVTKGWPWRVVNGLSWRRAREGKARDGDGRQGAPAWLRRTKGGVPRADGDVPPVAPFAPRGARGGRGWLGDAPGRLAAAIRGAARRLTGGAERRVGRSPSGRERMEPRVRPAMREEAARRQDIMEADADVMSSRDAPRARDAVQDAGGDDVASAGEGATGVAPEVRIGGPVDEAFLPQQETEMVDEAPARAGGATRAERARKLRLPDLDILARPDPAERQAGHSDAELAENAATLQQVLEDFGVRGRIVNVCPGPVVTLYEFEPAPGVKSARVIGLADDIARSMCAVSARIAVVPGRNVIGIELPNERRETVYLREMLESAGYRKGKFRLPLALGKNIAGEPVFADLARMPHLLIAGTTGSGKSVGINTFIMSLLYKLTPEQCRLIMIDPKMLELSIYEGIPHLLAPVVTDPRKAIVALKWAVREMEERYQKMAKLGVRNLDGYNARVKEALKKGERITRTVQTGFDPETGEPVFEEKELDLQPLPYIVVIIDEMADLMMVAGKDIEGAVQRLAQMARAAGIHVIMATQRPSVDVITGTIKANFPTRISFQVTSKIDSRTILGEQGAEQLLGQGDMLYMAGGGRIVRLHGPFVSDEEVEQVVRHLKGQAAPDYVDAVLSEEEEAPAGGGGAVGASGDELYDRAVQVVLRDRKVSTSYVQRRLQIGYNKAATLIERMEAEGLISAPNSKGRREILVGGDSARD